MEASQVTAFQLPTSCPLAWLLQPAAVQTCRLRRAAHPVFAAEWSDCVMGDATTTAASVGAFNLCLLQSGRTM
jgi:hypothetical protein